jgi:hypothetical protein
VRDEQQSWAKHVGVSRGIKRAFPRLVYLTSLPITREIFKKKKGNTHFKQTESTWLPTNHFAAYKNMYEACAESKDTSRVGRWGNFLCLLWQHWRRNIGWLTNYLKNFDIQQYRLL